MEVLIILVGVVLLFAMGVFQLISLSEMERNHNEIRSLIEYQGDGKG